MEGLVKIGPWGSHDDGNQRDINVAPHRLDSIVIRCGAAIDAISFTYAGIDGTPHTAGSWGGSGGEQHKVKFADTEGVTEVSGTYGSYGDCACIIRSLTFVTNVRRHGPFGESDKGTPFSIPVQNGGRVVGFFGRSGWFLDAFGVYVHP
ncbi:hypothetical protein EJB05_33953, partial [Eragrostis curvula]